MSLSAFLFLSAPLMLSSQGPLTPALAMPQYYPENNNVQDKRPENGDDDGETLPGLDLDAPRSFVTGMECGSFARQRCACRVPPAVSAQLKSWRASAVRRW
jgi:hypothetical protein